MTHEIDIRLTLDGDEAEEFRWFLKKTGAKYNVAALRLALARAYEYERVKMEAVASR